MIWWSVQSCISKGLGNPRLESSALSQRQSIMGASLGNYFYIIIFWFFYGFIVWSICLQTRPQFRKNELFIHFFGRIFSYYSFVQNPSRSNFVELRPGLPFIWHSQNILFRHTISKCYKNMHILKMLMLSNDFWTLNYAQHFAYLPPSITFYKHLTMFFFHFQYTDWFYNNKEIHIFCEIQLLLKNQLSI